MSIAPAHSPASSYRFAEYAWLPARVRNALRRRVTMAVAAGAVFLGAIIGLVSIPRQATRSAHTLAGQVPERPDTASVIAKRIAAETRVARADSALVHARRVLSAPRPVAPVVSEDTTASGALRAQSAAQVAVLRAMLAELDSGIIHAAASPFPAAFRALADARALRGNRDVQRWRDSLAIVENMRKPFETVGAGDPTYASLTSRINELGRSIRDAASFRRSALREQIVSLASATTTVPAAPSVPVAPVATRQFDTLAMLAERSQGEDAYRTAQHELVEMRLLNHQIDSVLRVSRKLANIGAPPLAMLMSAFVLAIVAGFAVALAAELKQPRIAHVREAEFVAGERVLTVIRPTAAPNVPGYADEKDDLALPAAINVFSESYRTLYLHLAATDASVPVVTVTGDNPSIVATVAANLAAVAAFEARNTLLIDADPSARRIASMFGIAAESGLLRVMTGKVDWVDVITSIPVARDRVLDILPSEKGRLITASPGMIEHMQREFVRLGRRYDFIVIAAASNYVYLETPTIIPTPDTILCARVGDTRLAELQSAIRILRERGRYLHGVALWDDDPPNVD